MIVRILGEGQLEVPDDAADGLRELDERLAAAVDRGDEAGFAQALAALLDRLHSVGRPVALDRLVPSQMVVPSPDAGMDEVRELLTEEGMISG